MQPHGLESIRCHPKPETDIHSEIDVALIEDKVIVFSFVVS